MPSIGASENHNDPDSILVDILNCVRWIHDETIFFLYRYQASFDVEVSKEVQVSDMLMKKLKSPCEFFESHLSIRAKNDVGMEIVFSCCLASFLPFLLHGKTAEHYRL